MNTKLTASLGLLSSGTLLVAYLYERKTAKALRSANVKLSIVAETVLEILDGKYKTEEDAMTAYEFKMITRHM